MTKSLMLIAVGAMMVVASAAQAAGQCNARDDVLKLLEGKYAESLVAYGVTNQGHLVEVLKSAPGAKIDTWTIIITTPQGVSCLVAAGEGWRDMEQITKEPEA